MTFADMIRLGLENLLRTKLRSALTIIGVVVGIGALTSMVSLGTGIQKNVTEAFRQSDLFTSLIVTAGDVGEILDAGDVTRVLQKPPEPLTDSTVKAIRGVSGVAIAFPEISFPVRVEIKDHRTRTTLRGLPAAMARYRPFNDLMYGEFFTGDNDRAAVITVGTLEDMGLTPAVPGEDVSVSQADSAAGAKAVPADSIVGRTATIVTAVMDLSAAPTGPLAGLQPGGHVFQEAARKVRIAGILKRRSEFTDQGFRGGIFVPIETADSIPRVGFTSVWDLLGNKGSPAKYASIYVRVGKMADMGPVRRVLVDDLGLSVFSIADQLDEIKRGFLVLDSVLGAVGTVALFVAGLGIVNTMVMSILERTREIGIMKALGASDGDIQTIFFAEAAAIGAVGAVFGLALGWLVTRAANIVVNMRFAPPGGGPVNLFYFPAWLIVGAVCFSILVSLLAGVYPARRAARVDPVEALRHD